MQLCHKLKVTRGSGPQGAHTPAGHLATLHHGSVHGLRVHVNKRGLISSGGFHSTP